MTAATEAIVGRGRMVVVTHTIAEHVLRRLFRVLNLVASAASGHTAVNSAA
jgi:hypothetical protein